MIFLFYQAQKNPVLCHASRLDRFFFAFFWHPVITNKKTDKHHAYRIFILNLNAYCGVYRLAGFKAGLPLAFLLYTI
jgi:hypothetical protein